MPVGKSTENSRGWICAVAVWSYSFAMSNVAEIEKLAFELTDRERAVLAAKFLQSLPPILVDEDEGIAEALRRDAEMERDPSQRISLAELKALIKDRQR